MDKLMHSSNVLKWFDIKKNVGKSIYLDEETFKFSRFGIAAGVKLCLLRISI